MTADLDPEIMRERVQGTRHKISQKTADMVTNLSHVSLYCDDGMVGSSKETILNTIEKIKERQELVLKRVAG